MNKCIWIIAFCFTSLSCEDHVNSSIDSEKIIGFWIREKVYLNGVNSIEYVDFLNGTNFLNLNKDGTFERAYDLGFWHLDNSTLVIERGANTGMDTWTYNIIKQSDDELIVEMKSLEGEYCCNFESFNDNDIITIREIYKRAS